MVDVLVLNMVISKINFLYRISFVGANLSDKWLTLEMSGFKS